MSADSERCETCWFWKRWENPRSSYERRGVCRRYPPQIYDVGYGHAEGRMVALAEQPDADAGDWCGEWRALDDIRENGT